MVMPSGQSLLLPANPWFIGLSLLAALLLNMLLHIALLGRSPWMPDFLALTLTFWIIHQPQRVGVGVAFTLGLLLDVHQGSLLGQHALAYTVMAYLANLIHRRVLWFGLWHQAAHVVVLFVVAHAIQWLARAMAGSGWIGWSGLLAPLLQALLWPLATVLLLAPQRRAHDRDENRPI